MRITYDPSADSLYIRFIEKPMQCQVVRLNEQVAVTLGPDDIVVGVEILDASLVVDGIQERLVQLENLTAEDIS